MRGSLALASSLVACSATVVPQAAPTKEAAPTKAATPAVVDAEAFLASIEPLHPFEVVIGGSGIDSVFGHQKCGRWEWTTAVKIGGEETTSKMRRSSEPITLIVGDRQVTIASNRLRMYGEATFRHDYARGDRTAPVEIAAELAAPDAPPTVRVYEFCLVIGRRYHAIINEDEVVALPLSNAQTSHDPTFIRRSIVINDEPFSAEGLVPGGPHMQHW